MAKSQELQSLLSAATDPHIRKEILHWHATSSIAYPSIARSMARLGNPVSGLAEALSSDLEINLTKSNRVPLTPEARSSGLARNHSCRSFDKNAIIKFDDILQFIGRAFVCNSLTSMFQYPSAGGTYSVQVFLGLCPGRIAGAPEASMFHLLPRQSELEALGKADEKILNCVLGTDFADSANVRYFSGPPAFYLYYAIYLDKVLAKYRYRAYRFALMEIGSIYQLALTEAQDLGWGSLLWATCGDYEAAKLFGFRTNTLLPGVMHLFGVPQPNVREL